jgi:hypothetical protein
MFLMILILGAGIVIMVFSRWFWKLAGLAAAAVLGLVLVGDHARLAGYALDLVIPVAAGYAIVKAAIWLKSRRTIRELPAETTSYPTSPAYVPSRSRIGAGK